MKVVVILKNEELNNKIKETIHNIMPNITVDIMETNSECYETRGEYDYAFLQENDDDVAISELIKYLTIRGVDVYLVAKRITKDALKLANESGAISVFTNETVLEIVEQLFTRTTEKSELVEDKSSIKKKNSFEGLDFDEFTKLRSEKYPAKIVSFNSGRGGTGKTTIAINVGVALAKKGLKTILLDFDVENGNVLEVLDMESEVTINNIAEANFLVDEDFFDQHSSGLYVFSLVSKTKDINFIRIDLLDKLLRKLSRIYDIIIIDNAVLPINENLLAMQLSNQCYFLTSFDVSCLASIYKLCNDIEKLEINIDKIKMILNRAPTKIPIFMKYISEYLSIDVLTKFFEEPEMLKTVNQKEVAYNVNSYKKFNKGINDIVDDITDDYKLKEIMKNIKETEPAEKEKTKDNAKSDKKSS